jgi:hypothetical protein
MVFVLRCIYQRATLIETSDKQQRSKHHTQLHQQSSNCLSHGCAHYLSLPFLQSSSSSSPELAPSCRTSLAGESSVTCSQSALPPVVLLMATASLNTNGILGTTIRSFEARRRRQRRRRCLLLRSCVFSADSTLEPSSSEAGSSTSSTVLAVESLGTSLSLQSTAATATAFLKRHPLQLSLRRRRHHHQQQQSLHPWHLPRRQRILLLRFYHDYFQRFPLFLLLHQHSLLPWYLSEESGLYIATAHCANSYSVILLTKDMIRVQ